MPIDLQQRKFAEHFDLYDLDLDGYIEWSDYRTLAADLGNTLMAARRPADHRVLMDGFRNWWARLCHAADTDRDGRISKDEYVAAMEAGLLGTMADVQTALNIADGLLKALDTSGDGRLSPDEYARLFDAIEVDREVSVPAFHRLDRDHDGVIDTNEWRAAVIEFFLSADPDAPGNWLLGQL
jgi:Ca2+-binding EF-hand superfamily protein